MLKAQRRLVAFVLCFTMLFAFTACEMSGGTQTPTYSKNSYSVTYDLNYEGAKTRVQSYQAGITAIDWKAAREGYNIQGWYTDAECTQKYDFDTKVASDFTLYAKWKEKPGMTTVTFDFGYAGAANKVVELEKGSTINKNYIPQKTRFGMSFDGWFKDEALTAEWDFDEDTVDDTTVLHAKFTPTFNLQRDEDGNIVYDNVSIFVWDGISSVFSPDILKPVVEAFNNEYKGQIEVTASSTLASQTDTFLRIQQTVELMKCYTTYYPIADIYSLADIEVNNEDYYAGAVRESMSKGVMLQTPFAGVVPYLVYNKTLMNKYSPDGLPTNYSELSAVLKAAAKGEASNKSFNSILTTNGWQFKEIASYVAFSQNDADYFVYDGDTHVSTWKDDAVMKRAENALTYTYDTFGVNGANKGTIGSYTSTQIVDTVSKGNALMGMVCWSGTESSIASNSNLGVMSLSGMFTDNTDEASKRVPIYTLGIAFYNGASNVIASPLKMAASAVFADYLAKNAYLFADSGFIPVHKGTAEIDEYKNSTNTTVKLLKSVCDPENYWTLNGMANTKYIFNAVAAEGVIVPYLTDDTASIADVGSKLSNLYAQVAGLVA